MIVDNEINILSLPTETQITFIKAGVSIASVICDGNKNSVRLLKKTIKRVKRKYNFNITRIVADKETSATNEIRSIIEKNGIVIVSIL